MPEPGKPATVSWSSISDINNWSFTDIRENPTPQLRFVKRPGFGEPPQAARPILQQLWRIENYRDGKLHSGSLEWRDVPLVEE